MPFKGEAKWLAPRNLGDAEAQEAKVYLPESDGPRSRDEFSQEQILVGQTSCGAMLFKIASSPPNALLSNSGGIPVWVRQEEKYRKE